jgi:hypothetical protein
MRIQIIFGTNNAAFEDNPNEVSEVLGRAIELIGEAKHPYRVALRDSNGNIVGYAEVVDLQRGTR